ncbi:MAG: oligosaccharide flippase family protein, partial [Bacteroidia bacterium]
MQKKVVSNAFHLFLLQVLNNILPLVTIPFLVQVLGADSFGILAFSQVVGGYLVVISDYGFNLSITRLISLNRDKPEKCATIFNQVITLKVLMLSTLCFVFTPFIFLFDSLYAYKEVYFLTFFLSLGNVLFPIWYFQGMQKMNYILWPNAISKVISTIPILFLVRQSNDLELAVLFNVLGALISGILGLYLAFK